jgi:hypothetical protein
MAAGDLGRWANAGNLLSQSARFLLKADQARAIIDQVENVVRSEWYRTLKAQGVSEQDAETLKGAFAYPGFRLEGGQPPEAVIADAGPAPSIDRKPAPRRVSNRKRKAS